MKIIQVINSMISNDEKITNVMKHIENDEYFFIFDKKYIWSVIKNFTNSDDYTVNIYPENNLSINDLISTYDWANIAYVSFESTDFKSREALETFRELYNIVLEKVYGIDDIFNDILNN